MKYLASILLVLSALFLILATRYQLLLTSAGAYGLGDIYASALRWVMISCIAAMGCSLLIRTRHLAFCLWGMGLAFFLSPCIEFYQKLNSFVEEGEFEVLSIMKGGIFFLISIALFFASATRTVLKIREPKTER
jgi:hypothetical protein